MSIEAVRSPGVLGGLAAGIPKIPPPATPRKGVRVVSGANEGYYPIAGKTIGDVRKGLRDSFSISPDSIAEINGFMRDDNATLAEGDNLEFSFLTGTKGGIPEFWSQSEVMELLGPEAIEELNEIGEEPFKEPVYTKQQVSALITARSSKTSIVDVPSNKLIVDFTTMTIRYGEQGPFEIDSSLKFKLIHRLSSRPGVYISLNLLKSDVWNDHDKFVTDEAVNRQARFAREAINEMRLKGVSLKYDEHKWALILR